MIAAVGWALLFVALCFGLALAFEALVRVLTDLFAADPEPCDRCGHDLLVQHTLAGCHLCDCHQMGGHAASTDLPR